MRFLQELLDCALERAVRPFTGTVIANVAFGVDEKSVRPGRVVVGVPDREVVIYDHGIRQPEPLHCRPDISDAVSDIELWAMNADNLKPIFVIPLVPLLVFSECANAVD